MELKFECIHCGQHISAAPEQIGTTAPCPGCNESITVPNTVRPIIQSVSTLQKAVNPLTRQKLLLQMLIVVSITTLVWFVQSSTLDSAIRQYNAEHTNRSINEPLGAALGLEFSHLLLPVFLTAWISCIWFNIRNLERTKRSRLWLVFAILLFVSLPPSAILVFVVSWIILMIKLSTKGHQYIRSGDSSVVANGTAPARAVELAGSSLSQMPSQHQPLPSTLSSLDSPLTKHQVMTARNMVYGSMALFALGLATPCMTMTPHMNTQWGDFMKIIQIFSSSGEPQTVSIIAGIMHMFSEGDVVIAVLITGFSILFPAYKLISMMRICNQFR